MFAWLAGCCCEESSNRPGDFGGDIEQVSIFPESCVSYDPQGQNVTYASDVDGRWDYFCNFVDHSRGLKFCVDLAPNERRSLLDLDLQLEEGWHFVYGGDACTQGPGSLRFLEAMVRLKKRWPGRVHLLLGAKDMDVQAWTTDLSGDFDCRREELAHLAGIEPDQVSDEEVAKSCEDQLKPGGGTWEYLQLAQLAILLGDTLFIHGEILSGNTAVEDLVATPKHQELLELGVVPDEDDEIVEDVQAWVVRLNRWVKNQIRQWELAPSWDMPVDSWSKGPSMIQQAKLQ